MSQFGFCQTNSHERLVDGNRVGCPGTAQRFYFDKKKMVPNGELVCDCACHTAAGLVESAVSKPTRRRRKK